MRWPPGMPSLPPRPWGWGTFALTSAMLLAACGGANPPSINLVADAGPGFATVAQYFDLFHNYNCPLELTPRCVQAFFFADGGAGCQDCCCPTGREEVMPVTTTIKAPPLRARRNQRFRGFGGGAKAVHPPLGGWRRSVWPLGRRVFFSGPR